MLDYFRILAGYNAWANDRLYGACAQLPAEVLGAKRPSFFGSILATLNHGLVGDRLWLARITDVPETEITALDQILFADFAELRAARGAVNERIKAAVDGLDPARLQDDLVYRTIAGSEIATPLHLVLAHMFNHATHHRGQVHDMLSQVPADPPPLDLIYYLREG